MRIGFFTDTYLPVTNGICYVIDILRKDLEAAGHEVWIFAPKDIRWHLPKEDKVIRFGSLGGVLYKDQFNSFFFPPKQLKKVKELELDVLMSFTPSIVGAFGAYCSNKLNIPLVLHYSTDLEEYAELYKLATVGGVLGSAFLAPYFLKMNVNEALNFYKGEVIRRDHKDSYYKYVTRHIISSLHSRADLVITTSKKMENKLKSWPVQQKIETIATGVDPLPQNQDFKKYFAKKFELESEDEVILYAGRLSIEKNLDLLLDAFELVAASRPKAKLLLVGDFQYRHNLEEKASRSSYKDRIIFAGQVQRDELGAVYTIADVFAFPSLTDCQALVLNEAALSGLPLVWCDEDLNEVLIDDKTGYRSSNDPTDFAQKLEEILSQPKLKSELGHNAKSEAEKYSEKRQTEKLEKALETVLKTRAD